MHGTLTKITKTDADTVPVCSKNCLVLFVCLFVFQHLIYNHRIFLWQAWYIPDNAHNYSFVCVFSFYIISIMYLGRHSLYVLQTLLVYFVLLVKLLMF